MATETKTLVVPKVEQREKRDGQGYWWSLEDSEGAWFSTFDPNIAAYLEEHKGEEIECRYSVKETDGKKRRTIVAIPGKVDPPRKDRNAGGGMSDEQADRLVRAQVLTAAATFVAASEGGMDSDVLTYAEEWLRWVGSAPAPQPAPAPAPTSSAPVAPTPSSNGGSSVDEIERLIGTVWGGREKLGRVWIEGQVKTHGGSSLEDLDEQALSEIVEQLSGIASQRKG